MPWFQCLARGENFLLREDGALKLLGFYTTRWVEAADAQEAEFAALAALKADELFRDMPEDQRNKEARVFFEAVRQLDAPPKESFDGFVFFPMEGSNPCHPGSAVDE